MGRNEAQARHTADLGAFALQRLDTRLTYIFYISTILPITLTHLICVLAQSRKNLTSTFSNVSTALLVSSYEAIE